MSCKLHVGNFCCIKIATCYLQDKSNTYVMVYNKLLLIIFLFGKQFGGSDNEAKLNHCYPSCTTSEKLSM